MLNKIYKKLCGLQLTLVIILLSVSILIITGSAISRSLGFPIQGSMDLVLLCFTWAIFLSADIGFWEGEFVEVDLLTKKLPFKLQKALEYFVYLLIFIFLCGLIYYGTILSIRTWDRSIQGFPSLSFTWVTLSLPVGSFLMLITLIV